MAINLWAAAGKPTAYSPLPTGFVNFVPTGINDYTVSFKAKSNSEAVLEVFTPTYSPGRAFGVLLSLTKEFKTYNYTFKGARSEPFYFYDNQSKGDIIIENITLVEKPIPPIRKPKKNLLPPFSQWTLLHANAKVIAPYELELNATAAGSTSILVISVLANQNYALNVQHNGRFSVQNELSSVFLVNWSTSPTVTFNSGANTKIKVVLDSTSSGTFIFKNPMLTEGTTAQPFEPFVPVNSRAVKGAKKNLFKGFLSTPLFGAYSVGRNLISEKKIEFTHDIVSRNFYFILDVKPNKDYTIKFKGDSATLGNATVAIFNEDATVSISGYSSNETIFFNSGGRNQVRIYFRNSLTLDKVTIEDMQIEEGTTATPFEPYREVNKRAGLVPAKNLFRGERTQDNTLVNEGTGATIENVWDNGKLKVANGSTNAYGRGQSIPVKIGKTYTLRAKASNAIDGAVARLIVSATDVGNEYNFRPLETPSVTFVATSEKVWLRFLRNGVGSTTDPVYFWDIQLEEGTTATPYEPYKPINPPAPKGIIMDGVTNYVQLPSMTMDSVEIDCLVDVNQTSVYPFIFDMRPGAVNTFLNATHNTSNISTANLESYVDGVKTTFLAKGERKKIKAVMPSAITDNVTVFDINSGTTSTYRMKGIIYGVKCYLNGNIVAEYDFTTENTKAMNVVMGTKTWRNKLAKR